MKYQLEINQKKFDVTIGSISGGTARVTVNGETYDVRIGNTPDRPAAAVQPATIQPASSSHADLPLHAPESAPVITPPLSTGPVEGDPILAPIPGLILDVKVSVGDTVTAGQTVAIIEAMKMENSIAAHVSGIIRDIRIQKGTQVSTRDVLMTIG